MHGISQNPDTNDYIIVFHKTYLETYCKKCDEIYTDMQYKWCKKCQINYLKDSGTTSGNEEIDNLIQEMQLKIKRPQDIVFEWIPYNQFSNIKNEVVESDFAKTYSAIWEKGPLIYDTITYKYGKGQSINIILRCLNKLQNITNEFLDEV